MRLDPSRSVIWSLILGMAAVAVLVTVASIAFLYRTAYYEQLRGLQGAAESLAGLMEAVAQFDIKYSARTHPEGSWGATMSQIERGMVRPVSPRPSEELLIGRRVGDKIRVMRRSPSAGGIEDVVTVDADGTLAQPLVIALKGRSGADALTDYGNTQVLAGYAYVPSLDVGVVYKVDLAEMRAPYVRAAAWSALVALLAIVLGAVSFLRFVLPLRREAERKLNQSRARLAGIVDSAMDPIITVNADQTITVFNRAAEKTFGYPAADITGQPLERLIPAKFRAGHKRHVEGFGATGITSRAKSRLGAVFGVRANGEEFPLEASISQIEIAGEKNYTVILRDITERKLAEERMRSALVEKDVLLKEIYHRVKNNLQVVSGLLNMQGRGVSDAGVKQLLQESSNRVKSMALVHEQLYRSGDLSNISFGEYAGQLVEHLMYAHRPLSARVPVRVEAQEVKFGIETAVPLGLIINELVSNAYKHGYESEAGSGQILLKVETLEDEQVCLTVINDGRGLPADFDAGSVTSLGMQLVATLTGQLGGELSYGTQDGRTFFEIAFRPERHEEKRFAV